MADPRFQRELWLASEGPLIGSFRDSSGVVAASHGYAYDDDGNLESQDISFPGAPNASEGAHGFAYDRAGRLIGWTPPGGPSITYEWDGAGNRVAAGEDSFVYDERNRLVSGPDGDYSYSPRGDLVEVGDGPQSTTFTYDALGRLTGYDGQVSFAYDSLDRIVSRGSESFSYAGTETDPVAAGSEVYGRGPHGDLLSYSGGGASGLAGLNRHRDLAFGFDPQGSLSLTRVYEPFGDVVGETGTASPALGYQGDYTDPASGQVWMGARWYEPGTASFLTRDTVLGDLSSPVSLNRYTYGFADPLEYLDPDGRFGFSLSGFFSGISRFFSGLWRGATSFASRAASFVSRTAWGISSAVSSAGRAVARWGSGIVRSTASAVAQVAPPIRSATAMAAKVFAKGLGSSKRRPGTCAVSSL